MNRKTVSLCRLAVFHFDMSVTGKIKVFSGNAHRELADEICGHLDCELGKASTERFSDGEFNFQIGENVRGHDVFIVQPTCPPTDRYLMELLSEEGPHAGDP